jgi:hypothetical protein
MQNILFYFIKYKITELSLESQKQKKMDVLSKKSLWIERYVK